MCIEFYYWTDGYCTTQVERRNSLCSFKNYILNIRLLVRFYRHQCVHFLLSMLVYFDVLLLLKTSYQTAYL